MFSQRRPATQAPCERPSQPPCEEPVSREAPTILQDAKRLLELQDQVKDAYVEIGRIKKRIRAAKTSRQQAIEACYDGPQL